MKILKIITNNWPIKLLAVLVAIGLWIYAASVKVSVAAFPNEIPVLALNLTPGYVAIFDQDSVKLNISADSNTWNKLSTDSFTAFIDLNGFTAGSYQVPINITTSVSGVSIISRNPTSVTVTIEPSISKDIPVVANISGDAATNMIAASVTFDPSTVRVTGPKSTVEGISQATAKIILTGESGDFTKAITVIAEDQKGDGIKNLFFAPGKIAASVKIVTAGNIKNLGVSVVTTGSPAAGYFVSEITTNPATISIVGVAEAIRTLTSVSTAPININNLNKTFSTNVNLSFPVGVQSNSVSFVVVTISITNQTSNRTLSIPVNTANLPNSLSISSISPTNIDLTISGSIDVVSSVITSDIVLTLDLSAASYGSHQYQITAGNFSLPPGIKLVNFTPSIVAISM